MGTVDIVARLIRPRGSSDRVFDVEPGAAIAAGVWTSPPPARADMRGVLYRREGAEGVPDEYGTIWKSGGDDYVRMAYVLSPSIATSADPTVGIQAAIDTIFGEIGESGGGQVIVPAGVFTVGTLSLRNHVDLVGAGDGSELRAKTNIGGPVLKNASAGDRFIGIRNLRIDGNKAAQSTGSGRHGIHLNCPDAPGAQEYADAYWKMLNVTIVDCKDNGATFEGRGEGKLSLVNVRDCDGIGFALDAPDCDLNLCSAGNSGLEGFVITQANNRLSNSKAFYSGRLNGARGDGFRAEGTHTVTGMNCEAQDNNRYGFLGKDGDRITWWGCTADSNNAGHEGDSDRNADGFYFDNVSYGVATGASRDRGLLASGNTRQQKHAIGFANGAAYTSFDLKSDGNATGHVRDGWHTNLSGRINSYGGMQELSYAATRTPNPTEGNYVVIAPLTGNITINPPAAANSWTGQEMTLQFTQDGAGNRTVSFGAGFRTNFSATATANRTSTVTVVFDGANWVQTGSQLDIT